MTQVDPQLLTLTENKLASWDLIKKSQDEQLAWAREYFPQTIYDIFEKDKDQPLQVVVIDVLFDVVTSALQDPLVPQAIVDRGEQEVEGFKKFCAEFPVRSASTAQVSLPHTELLTPENQFIVFTTARGYQVSFLQSWDQAMGITEYVRKNNVPMNINLDDISFLYKIFVLLQCMSKKEAAQVVGVRSNSSSEIFKV